MLQLNIEQVQRLQAIQMGRDLRHLGEVLGGLFPDVAERLGQRYPALIAHAAQRGAAHGLTHALCVARYLACWFVQGAEFEGKPGFEWAKAILSDPLRAQGAKVFQLCRRTREALPRLATQPTAVPGQLTAAAFDLAIAGLDAALMDRGILGALQRGERVTLGQACDIDALDLRLVETDAGQRYVVEEGRWRRVPHAPPRTPITLSALTAAPPAATVAAATGTDQAPALPARLAVLSPSEGLRPARLRLRTRCSARCDPEVHPLMMLNGALGLSEWRGPLAEDVALDLYAEAPADPTGTALRPALAVVGGARVSVLSLTSCGLRDSGTSLGDLQTEISVHPGEQHLVAWRRDAGGELSWPEPPSGQPMAPPARCSIERDGSALDHSRWQAGLQDLDRQVTEGLARMFRDWERVSGVSGARLQAEPAVMCGDAGLSWGWAEGPLGIRSPAYLRVIGRMELIACQLNLRLSGELALQGSLSRVSLQCHGRELLQLAWERGAGDTDLLPAQPPTSRSFRLPFVLQLESLVQADAAMLDCGPVSGAVIGHCGLRPRADGMGLQWFVKLSVEPVRVVLYWHDPLLGTQELHRPLLPALELLEWSLG